MLGANQVWLNIAESWAEAQGFRSSFRRGTACSWRSCCAAACNRCATVDSFRVAVLAALNIADELVSLRQQRDALSGNIALNIKPRTETLAEMLDAVLEENRKAG